MTDVKHMGVIGNLLINYLNFFIKGGHNRKYPLFCPDPLRTKKRVFAAEHTCTGHILECPPPRMSSRIYISTKILSRSFIYLTNWWHFHVSVCVCVFWEREGGEHPICTDTRRVIKI